jgi:hypothetical protein
MSKNKKKKIKGNTCYIVDEIKNSATFYLLNYLNNKDSSGVNYKSRLSHELLKMLYKDVNTALYIDITSVEDDLSFISNEFMNYFDVWFPRRICIINRNP